MTAAEQIRETLNSFDLGRWRLAWDAYLARSPEAPPVEQRPPGGVEFLGYDEASGALRYRDHREPDTITATVEASRVLDPTDAADAVLAHEVELAREVCEDADVDALAFPPAVAMPFGGGQDAGGGEP